MKLISNYLERAFEIKAQTLNTLAIEDKKVFRDFLKSYKDSVNKIREDLVYIDNLKEVSPSKSTLIILDLFDLNANNSSILKKLYEELEESLGSEHIYKERLELESQLFRFADDLTYHSRFGLKYEGVDFKALFKALGLGFDYNEGSLLDSLTEYMRIAKDLLGIEVFVLVNLDSFFTREELIEIQAFLCYNQIKVLALQNNFTREKLPGEHVRILDQDLCEI